MDRLLFFIEENSDKLVYERFMEANIIVNESPLEYILLN